MTERAQRDRSEFQNILKHIPNALSLTRIVLAFCFPFIVPEYRIPVIIIALLTEFFDGHLARRFNAVTQLGQALDPVADKLFVTASIVVLLLEERISFFQLTLVAMRDIVVAIGSITILIYSGQEALRALLPRISGKVATTLQFALLLALFVFSAFPYLLFYLTAAASCFAAIDYLQAGIRAGLFHDRGHERET